MPDAAGYVVEVEGLDAAHALLSRTYGTMRIDGRGDRHRLRLVQTAPGPMRFDDVRLAMSFDADASPLGTIVFGRVVSGAVGYRDAGGERRHGRGAVFLTARPDEPYTALVRDLVIELVVLDPAVAGQVAGTAPRRTPDSVRFTGYDPTSAKAAALWTASCAHLRNGLLANPVAAASPLVTTCAAQLLMATALVTFPNTALAEPTIEDSRDGSSTTLRRAVRFIDEYADRDISAADIAAAAHVTIRAVQLAFRRHLDTTPMAYLRRVRLEHAHRELRGADPGVITVGAVAARWGFLSHSRFSSAYRAAFGCLPSRTLHGH